MAGRKRSLVCCEPNSAITGPTILVLKFSGSGTFLLQWSTAPFGSPAGIAVDSSGHVFVTLQNSNTIQKFTSTGTWLASWGSQGSGNGQFNFMEDIAIDRNGDLYVADSDNRRIQKLDSDGNWLDGWGFTTKIIVGSIRACMDVQAAALAGAHIITIPPQFLPKMVDHKYTRETVRQFNEDAAKASDESLKKLAVRAV